MDPMFGLPIVKETKAEEGARLRNRIQERRLYDQFLQLENELEARRFRIIKQKHDIHDLIRLIKPNEKSIVCPFGFSPEEKAAFRNIRRGSAPSISLEEFDRKLREFRERELENRKIETERRYRRKLRLSQSESNIPQIISVNPPNSATLLKHKNKMKDTYERLESQDVGLRDRELTPRRNSSTGSALTLPKLVDKNNGSPKAENGSMAWNGRRHTIISLSGGTGLLAMPKIMTKSYSDCKLDTRDIDVILE